MINLLQEIVFIGHDAEILVEILYYCAQNMEYKIDYIYDYSDDHSFISLPEFVTDKYGRKIKLTKFISNIGNLYKNINID